MHPDVIDVTFNTGFYISSSPVAWVVGSVEHVAGRASNGDLLVFGWSPTDPGHWGVVNVSQNTGQQIAGEVAAWVVGSVEHLAGRASNGDLLVFGWSPTDPGHWGVVNVSQITGRKVATRPTAYKVWEANGNQECVEVLSAMGIDNSLLLFWWSPSHDWQVIDLSYATGQDIAAAPCSWLTGVEHIATHDANDRLLVFWFDAEFRIGSWRIVQPNSQVLAVHAALVQGGEGGRILYFGGDEHDKGQSDQFTNQHNLAAIDHTRLFDTVTYQISNPGSPQTDIFCSGHAFLPDGRLVVAGGTERAFLEPNDPNFHHGHWPGTPDTYTFDPIQLSWTKQANMSGGRWYPTLTTLADGGILALCGHPEVADDTRHNNNNLEIFHTTSGWIDQGPQAHAPINKLLPNPYPLYPRLHLLPTGEVFSATPMALPSDRCWAWNTVSKEWANLAAGPGAEYNLVNGTDPNTHEMMTSVLLPLMPEQGYRSRILLFAMQQPKVIDLTAGQQSWQNTGPRALHIPYSNNPPIRHHAIATLLPDGTVLVTGGSETGLDSGAVRTAELYDPNSDSWYTLATAGVTRQYHSVALLMPDGRVWTAGSNKDHKQSFDPPGTDNRELRIELYYPRYLSFGAKPVILEAPTSISPQEEFEIVCPFAGFSSRVALLRCGSVTHGFDGDQRYIGLQVLERGTQSMRLKAPPNNNVAPPGMYLLFLLSARGIPSRGKFVRVRVANGDSDARVYVERVTSFP
jgi:hypothetical protein